MANCEEYFCNHCKCETMFFLQSDVCWSCDECGNVLGSWPEDDNIEDLEFGVNDVDIIRCPECNNLVNIDDLEDDYLCPVCFEFLGDEIEKRGYSYDEVLDQYVKGDVE